jgi:hypothetical protein
VKLTSKRSLLRHEKGDGLFVVLELSPRFVLKSFQSGLKGRILSPLLFQQLLELLRPVLSNLEVFKIISEQKYASK